MPPLKRLPVFQPRVLDHSTIESHQRCPRKAFYAYWLRRAPLGLNYPIGFGVAYHKYREVLENLWLAEVEKKKRTALLKDGVWLDEIHAQAFAAATDGWQDPPENHKKAYLSFDRLADTLDQANERWRTEKSYNDIVVLYTERPFELWLPSGRPYGGRIDQIVQWNGKLWIRDFKTTSRMGSSYSEQFDPNNQMTGYTWAGKELSLRDIEGVIIEVVYNTKTKGPEFHQFLSTRAKGHIKQWLYTVEDEQDAIQNHFDHTEEEGILAWPMRTTGCNDYGGCYYRKACQHEHPAQIERWLESNTQYSEWDFTNPEGEEAMRDE